LFPQKVGGRNPLCPLLQKVGGRPPVHPISTPMGTRQTDVNFTQNSLSMQLKFPHMLQHPRRLSCTVLKTQLNWFYCDVVLVQKSGFLKAQLNGFCGFRVFQLRMSSAGYRPRQINIQKCANSYILNVRLYLDFFIVSYLHLSFN